MSRTTFNAAFGTACVASGTACVALFLASRLGYDYIGVWDTWDTLMTIAWVNLAGAAACVVIMLWAIMTWGQEEARIAKIQERLER